MARTAHHPAGERTGAQLLEMRVLDVTVHTWDLARSIGADESLDPDVVAFALTLRDTFEAGRERGSFAPPPGELPADVLGPSPTAPPVGTTVQRREALQHGDDAVLLAVHLAGAEQVLAHSQGRRNMRVRWWFAGHVPSSLQGAAAHVPAVGIQRLAELAYEWSAAGNRLGGAGGHGHRADRSARRACSKTTALASGTAPAEGRERCSACRPRGSLRRRGGPVGGRQRVVEALA